MSKVWLILRQVWGLLSFPFRSLHREAGNAPLVGSIGVAGLTALAIATMQYQNKQAKDQLAREEESSKLRDSNVSTLGQVQQLLSNGAIGPNPFVIPDSEKSNAKFLSSASGGNWTYNGSTSSFRILNIPNTVHMDNSDVAAVMSGGQIASTFNLDVRLQAGSLKFKSPAVDGLTWPESIEVVAELEASSKAKLKEQDIKVLAPDTKARLEIKPPLTQCRFVPLDSIPKGEQDPSTFGAIRYQLECLNIATQATISWPVPPLFSEETRKLVTVGLADIPDYGKINQGYRKIGNPVVYNLTQDYCNRLVSGPKASVKGFWEGSQFTQQDVPKRPEEDIGSINVSCSASCKLELTNGISLRNLLDPYAAFPAVRMVCQDRGNSKILLSAGNQPQINYLSDAFTPVSPELNYNVERTAPGRYQIYGKYRRTGSGDWFETNRIDVEYVRYELATCVLKTSKTTFTRGEADWPLAWSECVNKPESQIAAIKIEDVNQSVILPSSTKVRVKERAYDGREVPVTAQYQLVNRGVRSDRWLDMPPVAMSFSDVKTTCDLTVTPMEYNISQGGAWPKAQLSDCVEANDQSQVVSVDYFLNGAFSVTKARGEVFEIQQSQPGSVRVTAKFRTRAGVSADANGVRDVVYRQDATCQLILSKSQHNISTEGANWPRASLQCQEPDPSNPIVQVKIDNITSSVGTPVNIVRSSPGLAHIVASFSSRYGGIRTLTAQVNFILDPPVVKLRLEAAHGDEVPGTQMQRPLAVYFVLDVTGSMSAQINTVKHNVRSFVNSMVARNFAPRIGVIPFRDDSPSYPGQLNLTSNIAEFENFMNSLGASGGAEVAETSLEAAEDALLSLKYQETRPGALKVIMMITDAIGHRASPLAIHYFYLGGWQYYTYARDCSINTTIHQLNNLVSPEESKQFRLFFSAGDSWDYCRNGYFQVGPKQQWRDLMYYLWPWTPYHLRGGEIAWPFAGQSALDTLANAIVSSTPPEPLACVNNRVEMFIGSRSVGAQDIAVPTSYNNWRWSGNVQNIQQTLAFYPDKDTFYRNGGRVVVNRCCVSVSKANAGDFSCIKHTAREIGYTPIP